MKYNPIFKDKLDCTNSEEVFNYLIETLKDTITHWDYFVNWTKVNRCIKEIEIGLNTLNYLIGKDNIEEEAIQLLTTQPKLIEIIPTLLASREHTFALLKEYKSGAFIYEDYNFKGTVNISPKQAVEFLNKSGFLEQLRSKKIKSLVDYTFGVEVGLDSNGRKNRSGTSMENIVSFFVEKLCSEENYPYMKQATATKIKKEWDKDVTVDKSTRRFDFAINTPHKLILIETNFYGGGGSKLKSTAGEYKTLYNNLHNDGHQFIWITDGAGWKKTKNPLRETFDITDYIINLDMVEKGILKDIISK